MNSSPPTLDEMRKLNEIMGVLNIVISNPNLSHS